MNLNKLRGLALALPIGLGMLFGLPIQARSTQDHPDVPPNEQGQVPP